MDIGLIVSITTTVIIPVFGWLMKRSLKHIEDGLTENKGRLLELNEKMNGINVKIAGIEAHVERFIQNQVLIQQEVKDIVKLEAKFEIFADSVSKIPEMKHDLDEAHSMIRSLRNRISDN